MTDPSAGAKGMNHLDLGEAIDHALDGDAVLFVGSGFSRTAINVDGEPLMTGGALAAELSATCGLAEAASLEDASEFFVDKYDAAALVKLLMRKFQVKQIAKEHVPFGRVPWRRVYTTNYDNVIELAYREAGRAITPLELNARLRALAEPVSRCIHINGFIDTLDVDALTDTFKLTEASYATASFAESEWAAQLRHDISVSKATFFVGYSAYDLDIRRILHGSEADRPKTFFVVGQDPNELTRVKLSKYGVVCDEDTQSLAELLSARAARHAPSKHHISVGRHVEEAVPPVQAQELRDADITNLLLWGNVKRDLLWQALQGSKGEMAYVCERRVAHDCLDALESGARDVVIYSDFGNGKTVCLESLGALAPSFGYRVMWLHGANDEPLEEVEAVCLADSPTLLLVDDYATKRRELEFIASHRTDMLHLVCAARTASHDAGYSWLYRVCGGAPIEIPCDKLETPELEWFAELMDAHGLWGERAATSRSAKMRTLGSECDSELSLILLLILESPAMHTRLRELVDTIRRSSAFFEAVVGVMVLSTFERVFSVRAAADLLGPETLQQAGFRNNESVRQLVDLSGDRVQVHSSLVSRHLLTSAVDPQVTVSVLSAMARRADKLARESTYYYEVFKELMRFTNVQRVLPGRGKMNAVLTYFKSLKKLVGCKTNPNFWLQYSVADLALKEFAEARIHLKTAYAHAKDKDWDTFMLDNHAARLELEEGAHSPDGDRVSAMQKFARARKTIIGQVQSAEHMHYPFRTAALVLPFQQAHRSILEDDDLAQFKKFASFMLKRVEQLRGGMASNRHVNECRAAMTTILELSERMPAPN